MLNKRFINAMFLIGAVTLSFLITSCDKPEDHSQVKPNIVFIYTDDQAPWALGTSGNSQIHTPNMDKLAKEGAYFKNSFITTPVCSPARVSLMTSQYASEYGVYDFIPAPGHRLYNPDVELGLSPESITFPEILQNNGYTTGLVGKWHVGDWLVDSTRKYHPTNNGYDYFMGLTGGGESPVDPTLEKDGKVQKFHGLTTDILTRYAMEFIIKNAENPFLLSIHFRAPHGAWLPVSEDDWSPYEDLDPEIPNPSYPDLDIDRTKKRMKEYMASVSGVDRNLGLIMELLKALKIEENTIVIFSADHGYNMGHNGIEHKGNGVWITKTAHPAHGNIAKNSRPNMYDNSLKVPAIIKWPKVVKPGTVINEVMTSLDWYPTVVEMAKSEIPENKIVRGRSLVPLLKGEKMGDWDNNVYAEYSMINYSRAYMRTYRTPEWKLTRDFLNPERDELYHISEDPKEFDNLMNSSDPEIRKVITAFTDTIMNKMKEINDPLVNEVHSEQPSIKLSDEGSK